MGSKMSTEHAQMHAGKWERWEKWEPKGKGNLGNGIKGGIKNKLIKLIK